MDNQTKKYFNPSKDTIKASKEFIDDLKSGIIQKDTLPNTAEPFNEELAAKSVHNFTSSAAFLSIANE